MLELVPFEGQVRSCSSYCAGGEIPGLEKLEVTEKRGA